MAHITRIKAGDSNSKAKDRKNVDNLIDQDPKNLQNNQQEKSIKKHLTAKEEIFSTKATTAKIKDKETTHLSLGKTSGSTKNREAEKREELIKTKKAEIATETSELSTKTPVASEQQKQSTGLKNTEQSKKKLTKLEKAEQKYKKKKLKKQQKLAKKNAKKANKKPMPKFLRIITAPFRKIGSYFGHSWQELRQVRWPNRKTTWKLVSAVIIYTLIFATFITLLDAVFTLLFNNLLK